MIFQATMAIRIDVGDTIRISNDLHRLYTVTADAKMIPTYALSCIVEKVSVVSLDCEYELIL